MILFFTKNPNLRKDIFLLGVGDRGGGGGAMLVIFFLQRIQI